MSFFDRMMGRAAKAPEWASFMDGREFEAFVAAVREAMEAEGLAVKGDPAAGFVMAAQPGQEAHQYGLSNVAQMYHQAPAAERAEVVRRHFEKLRGVATPDGALERLGGDFDEARPLLKIRLFPTDMALPDTCVTFRPAEGVVAALALDLPDMVASVSSEQTGKWGKTTEELFALALDNVRAEPDIRHLQQDVGGAQVHLLEGESFFTATHALLLREHLPDPPPETGALVAMPNRHVVLYHPITDATVVQALNAMIPAAHGMFRDGPGSVSPHVYWWRDAAWWNDEPFMRIPAEVSDRRIDVTPPHEFVAKVLEPLTGEVMRDEG